MDHSSLPEAAAPTGPSRRGGRRISSILTALAEEAEGERISIGDMVDAFDARAYGPLIVLFVPPVTATADEVAEAVALAADGAPPDKPVLAALMSAGGVPGALFRGARPVAAFAYPESAARALGRAAERAELGSRSGSQLPRHRQPGCALERAQALRGHRPGEPVDLAEVHSLRAQRHLQRRDLGVGTACGKGRRRR